MTKLTPHQVDQIETYAEMGKSGRWIAKRLGLKNATVNYRMLRAGFDPWPGERTHEHHRGGFTPYEDARLLALARDGVKNHNIAAAMHCPRTSILIRLMTLEVRAEARQECA